MGAARGGGGGGGRRRLGRWREEATAAREEAVGEEGHAGRGGGHAVIHAGAATSRSTGHVSGQGQPGLFWTFDAPLK